jgi:hypothetical protein
MKAAESGKRVRAWSWCKRKVQGVECARHDVWGVRGSMLAVSCKRPGLATFVRTKRDTRAYSSNRFKNPIPSRWARLKRKQAKVDWISITNLQSTSNVFPFALQALEYILQRPRVPCTFRIQADPVEQEIRLLGIRAMLYRSVRCARGMAPGCEQDNAREQSDRWCVEKL